MSDSEPAGGGSERPAESIPDPADATETADSVPRSAPTLDIRGYQVIRELHRGGQGVVYEAIQRSTKRKVAIKLLIGGPHAAPAARKRFEREIELVAQLRHPDIIEIFDAGETTDGLRYYVMDYVRGVPLNRFVQEKKLTLEDTLRIFSRVCEAIQHAHRRGVIHRDLKPSNVLVDPEGNPKVLDFGLARLLSGDEGTVVSMTAEVIGTLPYMSPEQARGASGEIDARTDVYSLGVMLYELLTGHHPYPVAGQMIEVLKHIIETPPEPPTRTWDSRSGVTRRAAKETRVDECPIDRELQLIVMTAIAKERERRYQSSADLLRDLDRYLAGEAIGARSESNWYVARKSVVRFSKRHQLLLGLGLSVCIVVLGGAAWTVYKANRDREFAAAERLAQAEVLVREGIAKQNEGDLVRAEEQYEEALRLDPNSFRALGNLAIVKKDAYVAALHLDRSWARLEEAEKLCERALAINPDSAGLWNVQCVTLYSMMRYASAEEACRAAIARDATYYSAHSNLAKVLALQGKLDEALQSSEAAVRAVEEQGKARDRWATGTWRTFGTIERISNRPTARQSFERALECDPGDAWTHLLLARLLLDGTDRESASAALLKATMVEELAPYPDARIEQVLAQANLRLGILDEAVDHAQECLRMDKEAIACHFILAAATAKRPGRGEAAQHYETAMALWNRQAHPAVSVSASREVLWYETESGLRRLCQEAASALGRSCAP